MTIPTLLREVLDTYDEGSLSPDDTIEMAQLLIDTGLNETLLQYQQLCDYYVAEGLCYDVQYEGVD